jgi:hypothetical protein
MTVRRKELHLAAHFPGVNGTPGETHHRTAGTVGTTAWRAFRSSR